MADPMPIMKDAPKARSPEELRGFAVVAEACAEAFLNEPSARIVDDVARVARALGDGRLDGVVADEALRQRYSERFFVPTGPLYVPLSECSVRGAAEEEGRVRYAPVSGARADHVLRCYRAVGFDYRALAGFGPAVGSLRPDSLAAELAFMAFLARAAAEAAGEDPAASERASELLRQFAREHANAWLPRAARLLAAGADDLYARTAALAADAVGSIGA
ncbi:molecular chaperone TorD family protein [Gordonibacter sp. RACS_AR68]|uniref:molecular chaperone TorD family protein n=2 Tax=Gordonibacter TaxID=644652 RepID=UPI002624BFAF|nr:molecular chaperone TorD family protein [Gordonibacter sp. RACS_AR68]MDN4470060.1 molecular chaperone TorD family protein [Gordonibacter sp. RACS_AR68]